MIERSVVTTIHGRYLIVPPASTEPAPMLIGFHGYGEDAEKQMERLSAIPGSDRWLIVSIQGLHRFYGRRTVQSGANQVVASWMTRQNREAAIADNTAYISACIEAIQAEYPVLPHVVFAGFSQGVAMAFRSAANQARLVAGVIALGGDIPPEIAPQSLSRLSAALIARGKSDELYAAEQFAQDEQRLRQCAVAVHALTLNVAHEWPPDFSLAAAEFLRGRYPK